jgi:uncharacterized protein (DUF342 family)
MLKVPRLSIRLSDNDLTALLSVIPGPTADATELDACLTQSKVVVGIDPSLYAEVVTKLANPTFEAKDWVIARGRAPSPGQDAHFEPKFAIGIQAGHVREDGSLDYHDRDLLKSTTTGAIIGVIHDAVEGVPGLDLDGNTLNAPKPRTEPLQLLDGVMRELDGTVRATRNGVVLYKYNQSLSVVDRLVHQGPVDLHSGDLNMQGSLVVKGDVLRPFTVVATGDLEIHGSVHSSNVRADGNIQVRGGIRGGDGCMVCAGGDLASRHAESATLYANGLLTLQESINSRLVASEVHVKGKMRGGAAVAEVNITVAEAGADNGTTTFLLAGEPFDLPVLEAQRQIAQSKTRRFSERVHGRSDERNKGSKVGRAKAEIAAQEVKRLTECAKKRARLAESAKIDVTVAHAGVILQIGEAKMILRDTTRSTRFTFDQESRTLHQGKIE